MKAWITEKGYKLTNYAGEYFPAVAEDMKNGPKKATSSMGCIAALAYARYKAGAYPFAFLSMDNCSHNDDKIKAAMTTFADAWVMVLPVMALLSALPVACWMA